ncbi:DUF559 domain-containing protein [Escherichia coli]|nr:DUF559 domain-containing protein [Escherichia coli]
MQKNKTIWCRVWIIVFLLLVSFFFPYTLLVIGWLIWTIYDDLNSPVITQVSPAPTWRDVKTDDNDWLSKFCEGCESPAEEQFLLAMVRAFNLKPASGKLISPTLTLEMQVNVGRYRFDFLANGRQVIEIDGAAWHSSHEQIERDRIRDEYSVDQGYRVLRIPAKVVFNTPDKAISQVKAAIAETPHYTLPVKPKPLAQRKSLSQHLSAFSDGLTTFNRNISIAIGKQSAMADFNSAINTEKMLLEALVSEVELDMRIETMDPLARTNYENIMATIEAKNAGTVTTSREKLYCWKAIIKPSSVNDAEIQEQIEREYRIEMEKRNQRLAHLIQRCTTDPEFSKRFRRKIEETNYPAAEIILDTATSF